MDKFLNYFQIATLAVFLSLFGGKSIYIKITNKINPISLKVKKNGTKHAVEILLFVLVNLWTFEVLFYNLVNLDFKIFPYPLDIQLFDFFFLKIIGLVIVLISFVIYIWGLKDLGNSWRLGIDESHPGKLVTTGIYSVTRNPIYLFFNLYFLGIFFMNGNLIFLVFTILVIINLHYMIIEEEKFLIKAFGDEYFNYAFTTGRYFTFNRREKVLN